MKRTAMLALAMIAGALSCRDSTSPQFGAPAHLESVADIGESAVAGEATPVTPSVLITDTQSRPVPGVTVTFTVVTGGGTVAATTQATNSAGIATASRWMLGRNFGLNQLVASAADLPPIVFQINGFAPDEGVLAFEVTDPAGDTLSPNPNTEPAIKPPAVDLLGIRGDFKRDSLILTLTFASPVRPGNAQASNSIGGEIEFDIDDNALTGYGPADSNLFGASAVLGVDYNVDLFDSFPTQLLILSGFGMTRAPISYPGNSVVIRIPLRMLGNDDGNFAMVTVVGPYVWASDFFPNSGQLVVRRAIGAASAVVERSILLGEVTGPRRAAWKTGPRGWQAGR